MGANQTLPKKMNSVSMAKLDQQFFRRPALELAQDLIGKILVHRVKGRAYRVRIVETEAYVGPHDLACHASKGRTSRTEVMFGPGGLAYVYLIYGIHEMLNIVASEEGDAQAVLIRAAEPLDDWKVDLSGPGKLTRALRISRSDNGLDLTGDKLYLLPDFEYQPKIVAAKRVGIEYAKEWKDALLRFADIQSFALSKPCVVRP